MLADTTMDVGGGFFAVFGEFVRQDNNVTDAHAANFSPLFHGVFARGFVEQLQSRFDLDGFPIHALQGRINEQIAFNGILLIVWVKGYRFAVFEDNEQLVVVFRPVRGFPLLDGSEPDFVSAKEFARIAFFVNLDQPSGVAPCRFAVLFCCRFVSVGEVTGIIAAVFNDPANHRQSESAFCSGLDGNPLPSLRCRFAEARVNDGDFQFPLFHALSYSDGSPRRSVVGFKRRSANENDELAVCRVRLPIELFPTRPLHFLALFVICPLLAHRFARKVEASLADSGVTVSVD